MRVCLVSLILLFICAWLNSSAAVQLETNALAVKEEERASVNCTQPVAEQEGAIREADEAGYTLRRIELIGNLSTADEVLHRRIASRMEEGNLFSRRSLRASLKNVSGLKTIYPVTMKEVVARLDKAAKTLDLRICFKERPQPIKRAS
jgi:outer membrane protein assembly factor BamA